MTIFLALLFITVLVVTILTGLYLLVKPSGIIEIDLPPIKGDITMWRNANDPPKTNEGCWSKDVIVITNYGNIYEIAFFGNKEEGCWQRPSFMAQLKDEGVLKWTEKPEI